MDAATNPSHRGTVAIAVHDLSKRYEIFSTPRARLMHALLPAYGAPIGEIWALRDVSFDIHPGEAVGIIGRNGSGKSTLLQIIAGIMPPTAGSVSVSGKIAAMLELGSGFNPEYSGRENVILNGMLLGLSREEILEKFDEVAAFAELGPVLDRPVKTFSSGMLMRLAFSVQIASNPGILIIDEALSVGDFFFRQKCFRRLKELKDQGVTLLFVSHDMSTVESICSRALLIENGRLVLDADRRVAIRRYLADADVKTPTAPARVAPRHDDDVPVFHDAIWKRTGAPPGEAGGLLAVRVLDMHGNATTSVRIGGDISIEIFFIPDAARASHVYLTFNSRFGERCFTTSTYNLDASFEGVSGTRVAVAVFKMQLLLEGGEYSLNVLQGHPSPPNQVGEIIDSVGALGPLNVICDYQTDRAPFLGPFGLPTSCTVRNAGIQKDIGRRDDWEP